MVGTRDGSAGDGLRRRVLRAEGRRHLRAFLLTLPLCAFLLLTFGIPIAGMLWRAVADPEVGQALPRTQEALADWDGVGLPGDAAFAALIAELPTAFAAGTLAGAARRLNYAEPGFRSLVFRTNSRLRRGVGETLPPRERLGAIDDRWLERATWAKLRQAAGPWSAFYLLSALDLERDADGAIQAVPPQRAIYIDVLIRTFQTAGTITLLCLLLGFPVAYLLATLPARHSNPLMILVLLPFWTSILVRTAAWVVLLQHNGLVNGVLMGIGAVSEPLTMIFNRTGVIVAMTHVLLPFMILPLYSVMKGVPPSLMRAARSLGAPPLAAFLRVYLPQAMPGVAAGVLLVFIIALGYYITPALVGGAGDQMIAYFIAFYTTDTINWGMAAALGAILLSATMILFFAFGRLLRADRLNLG